MSYAFADKLVFVSESYNDPFDAFQNRNNKKKLCIVSDNKVIRILDTKMILIKWIVLCAKHVLHIFEEQYPDDKKPRKAIEAASNWIKDPSEKNRKACNDASYDFNVYYNSETAFVASAAYVSCTASHVASSILYDSTYVIAYVDEVLSASLNSTSNKSLEIKWQRY